MIYVRKRNKKNKIYSDNLPINNHQKIMGDSIDA